MNREILYWLILDSITLKPVLQCHSRADARELAGRDGIVASVRRE